MRIIKILAIGAIGFILGLAIWYLSESAYSIPWVKLPAPPQAVTELIPTGAPPFFIKTTDGSAYSYDRWDNKGWIQGTVPQNLGNPFEVKKPCNFLSSEFFPRSPNAPQNISDCFQETTMYADGYIRYAVVVDGDGNIWQWDYSPTVGHTIMMYCLPVLCLLIGLFLAFVSIDPNGNTDKA